LGGWPPEYLVYGILGVNILVYRAWQDPSMSDFLNTHFVSSMAHLQHGFVHTLLTNSVSHQEVNHLIPNMLVFYFFGKSLVHVLGSVKVRFLNSSSSVPLAT
jgi:membrane associated rhomboid family serine protease